MKMKQAELYVKYARHSSNSSLLRDAEQTNLQKCAIAKLRLELKVKTTQYAAYSDTKRWYGKSVRALAGSNFIDRHTERERESG